MSSQKIDFDETDKKNENVEQTALKIPRKRRIKQLIKPTLIVVLSATCLSGGIILHKMQKSIATENFSLIKDKKYSIPERLPSLPLLPKMNNEVAKPVISVPMNQPIEVKETVNQDVILAPVTDKEENSLIVSDLQQTQSNTKKEFLEGFTLKDAIEFKENFLTESPCLENYQKLASVNNKTIEAINVLNDLEPYCQKNLPAVKNIKEAFLKNKKQALLVYYKENNPLWLAYLKAIPSSLIEIRRINPIKNKPKDILYMAQNELLKQNVSKAIDLVTKLPLSMQQKMNDFYREASIYNRAKNSLDQLILSFESKGE